MQDEIMEIVHPGDVPEHYYRTVYSKNMNVLVTEINVKDKRILLR